MPHAQTLDAFVDAHRQKRGLEADLREVKGDIKRIEERLTEEFASEGLKTVKTTGGATVYLHGQTFVGAVNGNNQRLWQLLEDADLPELITVQHTKLRAWYRELDEGGRLDEIPVPLREALNVERRISLRVRSA